MAYTLYEKKTRTINLWTVIITKFNSCSFKIAFTFVFRNIRVCGKSPSVNNSILIKNNNHHAHYTDENVVIVLMLTAACTHLTKHGKLSMSRTQLCMKQMEWNKILSILHSSSQLFFTLQINYVCVQLLFYLFDMWKSSYFVSRLLVTVIYYNFLFFCRAFLVCFIRALKLLVLYLNAAWLLLNWSVNALSLSHRFIFTLGTWLGFICSFFDKKEVKQAST